MLPSRDSPTRPRCGQHPCATDIHLVIAATRGHRPLFSDWCRGRAVVHALMDEAGRARTLCYVVMPDHLCWLVQPAAGSSIAATLQRIKSVSAHRLGAAHGGFVWQRGYHGQLLAPDGDLRACARHLVGAPRRAGLVRRVGDYPLWDAIWL